MDDLLVTSEGHGIDLEANVKALSPIAFEPDEQALMEVLEEIVRQLPKHRVLRDTPNGEAPRCCAPRMVNQWPPGISGQAPRVKRHCLRLSLTWDHRVLDAAPAAEFLACVRDYLQAPHRLLA